MTTDFTHLRYPLDAYGVVSYLRGTAYYRIVIYSEYDAVGDWPEDVCAVPTSHGMAAIEAKATEVRNIINAARRLAGKPTISLT